MNSEAVRPSTWKNTLSWIVAVLVPIALVMASVRILLHPWFLEFEYRTPGFPPDPYGFSMEERLHYSRIALDYLLNDEGISFLADLRFPEGEQAPPFSCQFVEDCTRLYNDRELGHMIDVKNVLHAVLRVWYGILAGILALGVWAWGGGWWDEYRRGLRRGGRLTVALIGAIILLVLVMFGVFFTAFHNVFFDPGTWMFFTSDTLIRLFPERFWRDAFLIIGSLSAAMGLGLALLLRRSGKPL